MLQYPFLKNDLKNKKINIKPNIRVTLFKYQSYVTHPSLKIIGAVVTPKNILSRWSALRNTLLYYKN